MAMTDDDLLTPKLSAPNDALKEALLARTSRRVRFRAWRRRALAAGACLSCFALGVVTTWLRPEPAPQVVYVEVPAEVRAPVANAPGSPVPPKEQLPAKVVTPAELELAAEQVDDKPAAARRFREAGDRYLRDLGDYRAALRCYRNFLDEADPADRAAGPDDTWLLSSLKRAREQESAQ
jgi:hypothetical protein